MQGDLIGHLTGRVGVAEVVDGDAGGRDWIDA
jgi:hypothetical protein